MSKSTMNKIYRSFFSLIFCLLMFIALYGCGTGPDSKTTNPATGYSMTLTADLASLAAGNSTVITATVTDGEDVPVGGQLVTFTIPINNSTATITTIGGTTGANGKAVAVYTAGANTPTVDVNDTIQASVTGYTSGAIVITRTASGAIPPSGYRLTLTPSPVSLAANANSVLVAKVINNATGGDAAGVTVTFAIPINNSTATLKNLSGSATAPVTGITDAQGYAIATYTAGNHDPSLSIQDVVTASVTGSAGAAIITRLPTLGTGNRILSFTEIPETLPATPVSGVVIMKVKVTTDNLTSPPSPGVTVTFSILAGGAGTLSSTSATTDTNGEAYVIFTRPATGSGETVVRAQIPGMINGGDAARIVYWSQSAATSLSITVVPTPDTVYAGQQSIVVATVLNSDATPAAGQTVSFQFANGVATGPSGATINTINSGLTNASGEAWAAYTAGNLTPALDIIDIVQATVSGTVGLATITRSKSDVSSGGYSITSFGGIPATLPATGSRFSDTGAANCELKAKVEGNILGGPAVGIPVTFSIFRGPGTLPTVTIVSTDTNGEAWILFDLPVPGAGAETVVRATVPLVAPQTNGGDTVSVIYW